MDEESTMHSAHFEIGLQAVPDVGRMLLAPTAALLGAIILFGVAVANGDTMHNAAHDTRHAAAFPCH